MSRITSILSCLVAAASAAATAVAHAQGALKPVDARIVNAPSQPVPVTVIAPPATPATALVICRLNLPFQNTTAPLTRISAAPPVGQALICPSSVNRLDVRRVVLESDVPHHQVMVALGTPQAGPPPVETMIGAVSDGAPDLSLAQPVRIDLSSAEYIHMRQVCSSGIATIPGDCGGRVYLIGTPAN